MAIIAKQLDLGASIEQLRQEFNNLQADVQTIQTNPTYGSALIFEGPTDDEYETTLQVQDPTSDNLVYIPNNTGTLLLTTDAINATTSSIIANNTTNETVYPIFTDAQSGNRPLENDSTLTYNPSTNTLTTTTFVGNLTGDVTGTADIATSITVSANNSTNETVYPTFVDGATGTQGAETDTGLSYNPSTNTLTTTTFVGNLTGNVTGALTGNADTFTVSANNSTNETVYPVFVDGATGTQGAESDTALTYNPSTNLLTTGSIVIADAGNIGSSSDTNAIAISSAGVVTLSAAASLITSGTTVHNEDVTFTGAAYNLVWDKSANSLEFADGANAYWGTGLDLRIFHDGTNSYIQDTATGSLLIEGSTITIRNTGGTEAMANFTPDGAVTLYFDNSAKLATSSGGISVTGTYGGTGTMTTGGNIVIPDAGNIGSVSDTDAISIAANGNIGITQDLTITGNLTVNGATTTLAATNSVISDSLIELNNGAGSNANDLGFIFERGSTGDNAVFMWDESVDKFTLGTTTATGASTGNLSITGGTLVATFEGNITGNVTGNADTTTEATNVTASANNSANETVYPTFIDGATGTQGIETDTGLNYNPSTGVLTATQFTGNVTGTLTGNADTFTSSANDSANETVYPVFVDGQTGAQDAETDVGLTYNPSTGTITSTGYSGSIQSAAQSNITSLGTLTTLTVDNIIINGTTIGHTSVTDAITIASDGKVSLTQDLYLTGDNDELRFYEGANYVGFKAPALSGNQVWVLPIADASSNGDALVSDGSGNLTFSGVVGSNASSVTLVATNTTDAAHYLNFTDAATGNENIRTDTGLTYNPSSGLLSTAAVTTVGNIISGANIRIADAGTIGSASDTDAMSISSGGVVNFTQAVTMAGALTVTGTTTLNGNLVLGDAAADTLTIGATLQGASPLTFEGGTANGYETTFAITDPTADRTITFPDATGTMVLSTGNVATATALETARTIGGVSFDGTANINLPGVNAAGNQDTSGNAATFTATANDSTNEGVYLVFVDGQTGAQGAETDTGLTYNPSSGIITSTGFAGALTGNVTGNVTGSSGSTTGNAATATALATGRTIGMTGDVVWTSASFTGSGNVTGAATIQSGAVETAMIAADAITAALIADDVVNSEHIAADSLDAEHYAAGSVDATALASNAVTTAKINADAVTAAKIADDVINSEHYAAGSIDREHLAADIVDGTKIADNVVDSEHINAGAVDAEHMSHNSIDSGSYVDGSIDREHLAADIVDGTKIADDAINSEHYVDGSVDDAHLANDFVHAAAADTASGRITFTGCVTNDHDDMATATGSLGSIEIQNTGAGNDSFMAFHAGGDFAMYFGLDADSNNLAVGGWSMGAAKYQIVHQGRTDIVTEAMMANAAIGSAEMKSLSTLLIKNSAGLTLKTIHGAGV